MIRLLYHHKVIKKNKKIYKQIVKLQAIKFNYKINL